MLSAVVWLIFWLPFTVGLMAFLEYFFHRWPMHNGRFVQKTGIGQESFESHAALHHGRFFKQFDKEADPAARYISMVINPGYALLGMSPVWLGLCLASWTGGLTMAIVIVAHAVLWSIIHKEMHFPAGRWFARTRAYRYIHAHHKAHHEHPGTNFAALFPPVMDNLFGTRHKPQPPQDTGLA